MFSQVIALEFASDHFEGTEPMRGLIRILIVLLVLGVVIVGGGAIAIFVFDVRIPYLNIGGSDATNVIPTEVAQFQNVDPPTVQPPAVINTDNCEAVSASAQSVGGSGEGQRAQEQRTLPNGREFPGKAPNTKQPPGRPARNIVMIQFTDSSTQQERNEYIRQIGGTSRRRIDQLNTYAVTLRRNESPETLPASPIVVTAELDYEASALQTEPDDPRYSEQWALPVMGVLPVWESLPEDVTPQVIAVIDSGICLSHPDLAGRLTAGYDFVEDDESPQDELGHGCGVAGVIAAGVNNSIGIAGIAPNVQIMPLRVLDANGLGSYSTIAQAIVYAADNGADIINLSLAGSFYSQVMADAVAYARARGVIVIAAAGNYGSSSLYYPAAFSGVLAVGSVDPNLERSSFSNYGDHVTLYAPGRDVLSTTLDGGYDFQTGTSFAAPLVAGVTALNASLGTSLSTDHNVVIAYPPNITWQCNE